MAVSSKPEHSTREIVGLKALETPGVVRRDKLSLASEDALSSQSISSKCQEDAASRNVISISHPSGAKLDSSLSGISSGPKAPGPSQQRDYNIAYGKNPGQLEVDLPLPSGASASDQNEL